MLPHQGSPPAWILLPPVDKGRAGADSLSRRLNHCWREKKGLCAADREFRWQLEAGTPLRWLSELPGTSDCHGGDSVWLVLWEHSVGLVDTSLSVLVYLEAFQHFGTRCWERAAQDLGSQGALEELAGVPASSWWHSRKSQPAWGAVWVLLVNCQPVTS